MADTIRRGALQTAMIKGIHSVMFNKYRLAKKPHLQVSKPIRETKGPFVEYYRYNPIPDIPEKQIEAAGSRIYLERGFAKRFTPQAHMAFQEFPYEDIQDEKYGIIRDSSGQMGEAANRTICKKVMDQFNDGFDTYKTDDNEYVFSNSHEYGPSSDTYDNLLSGVSYSITALWTAINQMAAMTDINGSPLNLTVNKIIAGTALHQTIGESLKSSYWPLSDTNARNIVNSDFQIDPLITPYIDEGKWFVADTETMSLMLWMLVSPAFATEGDFLTKASRTSVYFRFATGFHQGIGVIGSDGP